MSALKKSLCQTILHREDQIASLIQLLGFSANANCGSRCASVPQSLFVYGLASTGKKFVVTRVVQALNYRHAVVNCIECYSQKLLFEPILNQLTRHVVSSDDGYASYAKCDNMMDFVHDLKTAADSSGFSNEPCVVVVENCERLRDLGANLLPAFLRLQELTRLNVCVVFLSDVVFEKFVPKGGLSEPVEVFFPQYAREEVVDVLSLDRRPGHPEDFYRNYLTLLVSVLYRECRDHNELRRMAALNFPGYVEPVESGRLGPTDVNGLWRHVQPHLKTSIENLHLRTKTWSGRPSARPGQMAGAAKDALDYELPYYTKYLLIAAYLASYNPEKTDKKIFFKSGGKKKKRVSQNRGKKIHDHNLGPKLFSLDRLLAIFYAILGERLTLTVNLQSQVSSLVRLKLLTLISDECLESPKLKCTVSLTFIKIIAQTVKFNVISYLDNLT